MGCYKLGFLSPSLCDTYSYPTDSHVIQAGLWGFGLFVLGLGFRFQDRGLTTGLNQGFYPIPP